MADDVQTVAAESSPAAETPTSEVREKAEPLSVPRDPEAYAEWRQTGKLPEKPSSKKDDSAPSRSADPESGKGAPVPETGNKTDRTKRNNAESRKEELNREIKDLEKNREIRELLAKRDALRRSEAKPDGKEDVKAAPSTAPEGPKRPEKPKQESFNTWDEYEKAKDKYDEDLADWKAAQRIEQYEQTKRQEKQTQQMQERLNEAKARYGDEAEPKIVATAKTVFDDQEVAPAIKAAIGRSAHIVDALYVMGSDQDDLAEFLNLAKNDPLEALRKWFTVEALVKQELAKNGTSSESEPARGTDGKFKPVRTAREAPAPRTELGGNSSPPADERARAVSSGDFRAFKADADRRDMARIRGR